MSVDCLEQCSREVRFAKWRPTWGGLATSFMLAMHFSFAKISFEPVFIELYGIRNMHVDGAAKMCH